MTTKLSSKITLNIRQKLHLLNGSQEVVVTTTTKCSKNVSHFNSNKSLLLLSVGRGVNNNCRTVSTATTTNVRNFSDRALGYSPMAPPSTTTSYSNPQIYNPDSKDIPTQRDVEIAGNIFSLQSSKRDKLGELKVEALANDIYTLDDAATHEQRLDLWLIDGLLCICNEVDTNRINIVDDDNNKNKMKIMKDIVQFCTDYTKKEPTLNQQQFERYLLDVSTRIEMALHTLPPDRCLHNVRDFFDVTKIVTPPVSETDSTTTTSTLLDKIKIVTSKNKKLTDGLNEQFQQCVLRFRLIQTQKMIEQLQKSWNILMKVTDHDIDRAAVKNESIVERTELPIVTLNAVLESYLIGNGRDRIDTMWKFMDKDNDTLLDEEEMVVVCTTFAIDPVGQALKTLLMESIEANDIRPPVSYYNAVLDDSQVDDDTSTTLKPLGKRKKRKEMKQLTKLFQKTLKNHFVSELEVAHRLRCSYSWANKAHQANRIDSVLIEDKSWSGGGGRKRYVELKPKISFSEFREVQVEHIQQLDKIAVEYLNSFREDLLVQQGRLRQRKEVVRDSLLFMVGICLIDYIIMSM